MWARCITMQGLRLNVARWHPLISSLKLSNHLLFGLHLLLLHCSSISVALFLLHGRKRASSYNMPISCQPPFLDFLCDFPNFGSPPDPFIHYHVDLCNFDFGCALFQKRNAFEVMTNKADPMEQPAKCKKSSVTTTAADALVGRAFGVLRTRQKAGGQTDSSSGHTIQYNTIRFISTFIHVNIIIMH